MFEGCSKDAGIPVPTNAQEKRDAMCNKDNKEKMGPFFKCLKEKMPAGVDMKAEHQRIHAACPKA